MKFNKLFRGVCAHFSDRRVFGGQILGGQFFTGRVSDRRFFAGRVLGRRLLAGLLCAILLFPACGVRDQDEKSSVIGKIDQQTGAQTELLNTAGSVKGRYAEKEIPWVQESSVGQPVGILPEEGGLYLPDAYYHERRVKLDGADFSGVALPEITEVDSSELPAPLQEHLQENDYIYNMVVAGNGARMYSVFRLLETDEDPYDSYVIDNYFLDAQGTEQLWDAGGTVGGKDRPFFAYGQDGYFYVMIRRQKTDTYPLYRVDITSGETKYLMELDMAWYIMVAGGKLFVESDTELQIYDLATLEKLEEDPMLTELVRGSFGGSNGDFCFMHLIRAGEEDSLYVATNEGLYRHVLYGNVSELVIDGALCSLGDVSKMFVDLYVAEADESGMPVFYFLYDSGKLVRFAYDAEMPSVPENLITLYSLNESDNIRRVISAYQALHPETYVKYEVGMSGTDGATREDALKNLATSIASGNGPDIFLMEELPLRAYTEKGVLMDLSDVYGELKEKHQFFEKIIDALYVDGKLYTIPQMFLVPMLAGDAKLLQGITDEESMVKAIEALPAKNTLHAGLRTPQMTLQCMSYNESGSWLAADGTLDKKALEKYLLLCKRLYEADRRDVSEERLEYFQNMTRGLDDYTKFWEMYLRTGNMSTMAIGRAGFGNEVAIGAQGGDIQSSFNFFYSALQLVENTDYMLLPGEKKSCLPLLMLSVNQATPVPEAAKGFVKFALSDFLESADYLDGIPINRDVLSAMEGKNPYADKEDPWAPYIFHSMGCEDENGETLRVDTDVNWKEPAVYDRYNALLDSVDSVNLCEYELLRTVLEDGVPALTGEKSIEETVDAIAKKMQIYLLE